MNQTTITCADCSQTGIQCAIDRVAASGGGTVSIPPGVVELTNALQLRSNVRVVGSAGTVLRRTPSVASRLVDRVGYGHYEFTVEEPDLFPIGCGVHIFDDLAWGFYTTAATVTGRRDDLIFIDRSFSHDYSPAANGMVARLFSIVEGVDIHNASLANVTLDGNPDETRMHDGCRGAGIYLLRAHRVELDDVEVLNFRGDAISFQACTDTFVRDTHLHHNQGVGIHPGSGSVRYELLRNRIHHNASHGIFYCLRSTHSCCSANTIKHNKGCGISVGERDTHHLIHDNTIADNANIGIEFRPFVRQGGDHVVVEGNRIGPNCRAAGGCEVLIATGHRDVHITRNLFIPADGKNAVAVEPGCTQIAIRDNLTHGTPLKPRDSDAFDSSVAYDPVANTPEVGPNALTPDGARHLGIDHLPLWRPHTLRAK